MIEVVKCSILDALRIKLSNGYILRVHVTGKKYFYTNMKLCMLVLRNVDRMKRKQLDYIVIYLLFIL